MHAEERERGIGDGVDASVDLLGNVGISVEEAKAKGGSTVMGRRGESRRVSTTAMRAGGHSTRRIQFWLLRV